MPYISNARLEAIKLAAKIDVLKLALDRSEGDPVELLRMVEGLTLNLQHMLEVIERNARL